MQKWKEDFLFFCKNKIYVWMLGLTALFGYGFLVTHHTVGIDDTPYIYYFEEGLNVIVGRWFLYLLNKVFCIADFVPFVTDLAGVLILMVAVTVWATLLYSLCGNRIPKWGYCFFACTFLSCPLISEVYTYHLHNGVSIGYLCTGISLCFVKEFTESAGNRRRASAMAAGAVGFLFVALGCYESFMMVWLAGLILVLLTQRYMGAKGRVFTMLLWGAAMVLAAMVLRSLMINICTFVFGLEYLKEDAVQRSVAEMLGWLFEPEGFANFAMALKRCYVMYFAFGYVYLPIRIFVLAAFFMMIYAIYRAIRQRDGWIAVLTVGCFAACFLLVVVEGSATLYRSAQFLPVICGYGVLLFSMAVDGLKEHKWFACGGNMGFKACRGVAVFVLCVILWNQCHDLNRWFYVDWAKYQSAVDLVEQIAWELEKNYDTSKPIVFTGYYEPPKSVIEDAFVKYYSEDYYKIKSLTDPVDEYLLDKFYRGEHGVWVAQTPALSVIDWATNAFGNSLEMVELFGMHGYEIVGNTDQERFQAALLTSIDWPGFPAEGSIVDMGEYIIVHF